MYFCLAFVLGVIFSEGMSEKGRDISRYILDWSVTNLFTGGKYVFVYSVNVRVANNVHHKMSFKILSSKNNKTEIFVTKESQTH